MPKVVKISIFLLIISCCVTILSSFLIFGVFADYDSFYNYIFILDILWLFIVLWIISDLSRNKKDIRLTLFAIFIVLIFFLLWDYVDYGISPDLILHIIEALIYVLTIVLLSQPTAKTWYFKNPKK